MCSSKLDIMQINAGSYLHLGSTKQLYKIDVLKDISDFLSIDVNIDGLPIFNTSRAQLWPILITLSNIKNVPVLPIGVSMGYNKPLDWDEILD